jgi:hypothetical protein
MDLNKSKTDVLYCVWCGVFWCILTSVLYWLVCCTVTDALNCHWCVVLWLVCCTVTGVLYCDWYVVLWLVCFTVTGVLYCDWFVVLRLVCCTATGLLYCDWFLIHSLIEIRQCAYSFMCVIYFRILLKQFIFKLLYPNPLLCTWFLIVNLILNATFQILYSCFFKIKLEIRRGQLLIWILCSLLWEQLQIKEIPSLSKLHEEDYWRYNILTVGIHDLF